MDSLNMKRSLVILTCGLGLVAGLQAQDAEGKVKIGDAEGKATLDVPDTSAKNRELQSDINSSHQGTHVANINKATGLLGMPVKNHQNEKLGSIREIVLDLDSGKVGYAVLSIGGFLGIGDKLVAVPVNALSVGPDRDSLVVDADKARLQEMPALTKEWPEINDPQIASHWNLDNSAIGGAAARVQIGEAGNQSTLDRSDSKNTAAAENQGEVFSGKITMIDPEKRTMRVEGESGSREFTFTETPTLFVGRGSQNANLVDFKVGYRVQVGYHNEGDKHVAHRLTRTDAPGTR
jgi:sporulation protein YlmC with PRC-barrel domain